MNGYMMIFSTKVLKSEKSFFSPRGKVIIYSSSEEVSDEERNDNLYSVIIEVTEIK